MFRLGFYQIAQAIQDSLRDSFETSPTINRDASLVNGTHDTSTLNGTSDAFSIDNFVRDVDSAGPSSLTPDNDTSQMDEERHTCDEKEKCNVSIMSTTSDSDENPDCSSISESGERVRISLLTLSSIRAEYGWTILQLPSRLPKHFRCQMHCHFPEIKKPKYLLTNWS
jgi:hypothetical protein